MRDSLMVETRPSSGANKVLDLLGEFFNFLGLVDERKRQHLGLFSVIGLIFQFLRQLEQVVGVAPQSFLALLKLRFGIGSGRERNIVRRGVRASRAWKLRPP